MAEQLTCGLARAGEVINDVQYVVDHGWPTQLQTSTGKQQQGRRGTLHPTIEAPSRSPKKLERPFVAVHSARGQSEEATITCPEGWGGHPSRVFIRGSGGMRHHSGKSQAITSSPGGRGSKHAPSCGIAKST